MKFGKVTQIGHLQGKYHLNFEFFKNQDGGDRYLEKPQKSRYHKQRIGRSSQTLAWLCNMGLLTAQTVKKFEFRKSKMADGRNLENG